jgi:mono/diheme cytochrome c family protein
MSSLRSRKNLSFLTICFSLAICAVLLTGSSRTSIAQDNKTASASGSGAGEIARGKYIVEDVAMCGTCHTPRNADGSLDMNQWLAGGPVVYLPAQPRSDWPLREPRLAGNPPASNAGMVTLLTTGLWIDGKPLRDPMPKFHMTKADAEAVVAYLRSLSLAQ